MLVCICFISSDPEGALALKSISDDYRVALQNHFDWYVDWCHEWHVEPMCASSLNAYIARVSAFFESSGHAKRTRAATSWIAKLNGLTRPCDALTWSCIRALEKVLDCGGRFLVTWADFVQLKGKHVLRFLGCTGLRPSELAKLGPKGCHKSKVRTMPTKFAPEGRFVPLSPLAREALSPLLASPHSDTSLIPPTQACLKKLQEELRRSMTSDPECLPPVSLYALRHLFATQLYIKGCSSAFIMDCMRHKSWKTTSLYIHVSELKVVWRCSFEGDPSDPFLPEGAATAPYLQEPGMTNAWISKKRKFQELDEGEDVHWDDIDWRLEGK